MGMNAAVIGIGPFSRELVPHLEYPADRYEHTREGVTIAVSVFFVESGSTDSRRLAEFFSIDPWDFNQHELDAGRADLAALRAFFDERATDDFIALRSAGFRFFFMPNG